MRKQLWMCVTGKCVQQPKQKKVLKRFRMGYLHLYCSSSKFGGCETHANRLMRQLSRTLLHIMVRQLPIASVQIQKLRSHVVQSLRLSSVRCLVIVAIEHLAQHCVLPYTYLCGKQYAQDFQNTLRAYIQLTRGISSSRFMCTGLVGHLLCQVQQTMTVLKLLYKYPHHSTTYDSLFLPLAGCDSPQARRRVPSVWSLSLPQGGLCFILKHCS